MNWVVVNLFDVFWVVAFDCCEGVGVSDCFERIFFLRWVFGMIV